MGNSQGDAGEPWLSAGFYDPYPNGNTYRGIESASIRGDHDNPADPSHSPDKTKKERYPKRFHHQRETSQILLR